jgi:uncharacterized protein HemX
MYPGKEFENIVIGIQYNKKGKGCKLLLARVASYFLSAANIILVVAMFALGTISFGLLWHPKMKENLFYVGTMNQHLEKTDDLKKELLSKLEEHEMNQDKKLDKVLKKQEERGKRQLTKIAKKQKEYTKKQKEHLLRFNKIDQNLNEIKNMIIEMGPKP